MTQLSRETLEEIAELARKATYKPCAMHITNLVARCDSEVVEELIRELLERRERDGQEPAAYVVCTGRLYQDRPFLSFSTARISVKDRNDGAEIKSLYAAPPAPVAQSVQVPDELLSAMEEVLRISDRDHEAWQRAREGIAALRAAMPQPSSGALQLVGEVVARNHPNHERNVDFRWLDFKVDPGTKLYAIKQERS